MTEQHSYGADEIQVLDGLEAVRKRPGMYIGGTGPDGLHHLVYEIADNSIDEALAGNCTEVNIIIGVDKDGEWVSVQDNGRGIPIAEKKPYNKSALEVVMTVLHAGGKFGGGGYKVSGGLHGVGLSVVNALSTKTEAQVVRDGQIYRQEFHNIHPPKKPTLIKAPKSAHTGTTIRFWPDKTIFEDLHVDYDVLRRRLRQTAFLTPQVKIILKDTREGQEDEVVLHYEAGLADYIKHLTKSDTPLVSNGRKGASIITVDGESNDVKVDVALTYTQGYSEKIYCFANNIYNPEGGTHQAGFRKALTKAVNEHAKNNGLFKKTDETFSGEDLRDGLVAVISVKLGDPQFEGQTKMKLGNPHVAGAVESVVYEQVRRGLEADPALAKAVVQKCITARHARLAAKKAREAVRSKGSGLDNGMVGKLSTATSKVPMERELFIVEGDSAGGSAKQAREKRFQAIMPLKGKPLNIEKATDAKIYDNEEIKTLIYAIGAGIGRDYDAESLNYGKIIIMADADVDGSHIICLLLTFFLRKMPHVITDGHLWIAQPPLFQIKWKKSSTKEYVFSNEEKKKRVEGKDPNSFEVSRFKGLGEMNPNELWDTAMNPTTRKIVQVTIDDAQEADQVINDLMGTKVEPRKDFITKHSKEILEQMNA